MTAVQGTEASTDGAVSVLRRGMAATPELRRGLGVTIALAMLGAFGRVVIPVLTQQVIDRGLTGSEGPDPGLV
ncbi:MAG: ABC transporter ATP-binding protein, partial [Acidimicrobiales bacterium]